MLGIGLSHNGAWHAGKKRDLASWLIAIFLTTSVWLFVQTSEAAPLPGGQPIGDKWAVIVGISKFADSHVPTLKYSAKDARDFADYLTDPKAGKFRSDHVRVLLNEEATKVNIMDSIGDSFLPHAAAPGDLVVIYLSTHGSPAGADIRGVNYVVAYDTQVSKLFATGLEMKQLLQIIKERVHTNRILLVLDTCYSGAGAEVGHKGLVRTNVDAQEMAQGIGSLVISSSMPTERAWESDNLQNGYFTHYLIESLKENPDNVTVDKAFESMKSKVQSSVLKDKGEMQTPVMSGSFVGPKLVLGITPAMVRQSPFTVTGGGGSGADQPPLNLSEYAQHMHLAKQFEGEHKLWDAAHELEISTKLNPSSVDAYLAAATVYDSQGRYDLAFESAKRAVINDANSSQAHELLGRACLRSATADEALRQAQIAITLDPSSSTAHNLLGYINEHNFKRNDLAEQEYRRALSLNNLNVEAMINLGLLLDSQNRQLDEAGSLFKKAVESDADDWKARLCLGQYLYRRKSDAAGGEAEVRKALELDPANAQIHSQLAFILSGSSARYDEAEQEFRKSIELQPDKGSLHLALADFLCDCRKRPDEAEKEYRKAIECDKNLVDAYVGLGNLLITYNKAFDEADSQFKKALAADPRNAEAHVGLSRINALLYHNYSGAEEELKKALAIDRNLASAHLNLGILFYENMNRASEAKSELEAAIKTQPGNGEAHYYLGMVLAAGGTESSASQAHDELVKALALSPQTALYETKLGWLLAQSFKNYKEAEGHYRNAIQLNNLCSEAHYRLGLLLIEKLGMRKSGDEELRTAYEQNPSDPQIKAAFTRYVGK
ncbi:MAG: hypothetical protein C5B53_02725 [Candidatus Melainabacteria bacterium]|nr:MAG: hypothetical protein C5B53_02725 [Candidatus Melainabacteria bacterium]